MRALPHGIEAALLLLAAMYFVPIGVEWKILFVAAALLVLVALRIDSRFFILAALLHLWFAPFMLLAQEPRVAELAALYAFYYLAAGAAGLVIERWRPAPPDLEYFIDQVFTYHAWLYITALGIVGLGVAYLFGFEGYRLMALWYVATLSAVLFLTHWLLGRSSHDHHETRAYQDHRREDRESRP